MTPRGLLFLGSAAVVVIGGALWLSHDRTSSGTQADAVLYPTLQKELDAVTAVKVFKAGDVKSVEIQKADGTWRVAELSSYPADPAKVSKLLIGIAEAKILEEKTSNPQNYATLGVEDTSNANAAAVRIELTGPAKPVSLLVGKQALGAQSQYVRRAGEPQSWLVNTTLDTSADASAWLRKDILDISADRVQSATVAIGPAKPYSASKSARTDGDFKVELPKGKEISSPSAANTFATALVGLTLVSVQPAQAFSDAPPTARADFKTFDGLDIHIDGWKKDNKHFIAVRSAFDGVQAQRFHIASTPAAPATAAEAPKTTSGEDAAKKVEEEAKTLNARVSGWAYEIPDYKYEAIFKPLDSLLKK